ncbi:MAG: AMP-binding protein [Bacteroidales bacterium]|nr:AMP-binding protein [Bacteroidales bacterium]MDT8432046.1 AMP-binding protein [Bacteroidales bacterium]
MGYFHHKNEQLMFEGPFNIDGHIYTRESLLEYCAVVAGRISSGVADGKTDGMAGGKAARKDTGVAGNATDRMAGGMTNGTNDGMSAGMSETGPGQEWKKKLYRFISELLTEDRPIVQQTSGTTGDPKVYELDRTAMVHSAKMTLSFFGLTPGNTALLCLPVDYIAGKMMVVRAFMGNLRLVTTEPSGNPLNNLTQPVDFAAMVPLQIFEALKTPEKLNETIGILLIGGGEISETLRNKIRQLNRVRVYESFAMTETLTHFALRRLNGPDADTLFRTLEGVTIGSDDRGCLTVSAEGITPGTLQTNDLVRIHAPGAFEWLGRYDNVIKTGGIKVIPERIERIVKELLGREAVIVPFPDSRLGQRLVLVLEGDETGASETFSKKTGITSMQSRNEAVQRKETEENPIGQENKNGYQENEPGSGNGSSLPGNLLEDLKTRLEKHEIPKEIHFLPQFPRNRSMKIDRREVQRMISARGKE